MASAIFLVQTQTIPASASVRVQCWCSTTETCGKMPTFCNRTEAAALTGLSPHSLKKLRLSGRLTQGIHWVYITSRSIAYNRDLLLDWVANRSNPAFHERAIENYLASLPSSQPPANVKSNRKTAA